MASFKLPTAIRKRNKEWRTIEGVSKFIWSDIQGLDEIGSGSFGTAYKGNYRGETVVVKRLKSQSVLDAAVFFKEGNLINSLNHENIVELKGWCNSPYALMLDYECFSFRPFSEHTEVTNLLQFLNVVDSFEEESLRLFSPIFLKIAQDVSRALVYLHGKDVAHRDLKPSNVLVSNNHYSALDEERVAQAFHENPIKCKVTDFGESRSTLIQTRVAMQSRTENVDKGTIPYMAPELILDEIESVAIEDLKKIDIWALGMTLFVLINPVVAAPYQLELMEGNVERTYRRVIERLMREKKKPRMANEYHRRQASEWYHIERAYQQCTMFDGTQRPSAEEVLNVLEADVSDASLYSHTISIGISQSSAIEQMDLESLQKETLASENFVSSSIADKLENDGTNTCSFLGLAIAYNLASSALSAGGGEDNDIWKRVVEKARQILLEMPSVINKCRNRDRFYDVLEAIQIMKARNLLPANVELYEKIVSAEPVFSPEGRSCLRNALSSNINGDTVIYLYTCEPYVFLVGVLQNSYFVLDTHPIGESLGHGVVVVFPGLTVANLDSLCHWLWRRLAQGAVNDRSGQSLSQIHIKETPLPLVIINVPNGDNDDDTETSETSDGSGSPSLFSHLDIEKVIVNVSDGDNDNDTGASETSDGSSSPTLFPYFMDIEKVI